MESEKYMLKMLIIMYYRKFLFKGNEPAGGLCLNCGATAHMKPSPPIDEISRSLTHTLTHTLAHTQLSHTHTHSHSHRHTVGLL